MAIRLRRGRSVTRDVEVDQDGHAVTATGQEHGVAGVKSNTPVPKAVSGASWGA
jgi:hypothetical protein